ncbi:hypothetical protein ACLOJK_024719 [Asimina triloba]
MADLFNRQAKQYAEGRPSYPLELFQFIASKTPEHELAWDVGTGNGQAAVSLAGFYKNVVGTDTSAEQLSFAEKLPNVRYQQTTPALTVDELKAKVGPHQTVDLVTVAQAFHWFDRPTFYQHVKWLSKRPNGVLAVWCYTLPRINDSIDAIIDRVYAELEPFWAAPRKMVDDEYRSFEFPFEPVEGTEHTGPFEFEAKQSMDLDAYLTYIQSWSAYQIARQKGIEHLTEEVVEDFKRAWGGEDEKHSIKVAKFPVFLRIGKVGNE